MNTKVASRRTAGLLMFVALLFIPTTAYAYIDPNAAGGWFQFLTPIFALLVAVWIFLKQTIVLFVRKIASKFRPRPK